MSNIFCVWRVFMMCFTHSMCQLTALYQLYQLFLFWLIHVYWFDFLSMVIVMTYGPFYYKLILCHRKHNHVSITIIGRRFHHHHLLLFCATCQTVASFRRLGSDVMRTSKQTLVWTMQPLGNILSVGVSPLYGVIINLSDGIQHQWLAYRLHRE